ncbi:RICIN domain-containing protein [Polyangium aurulentum]|uniref:RICIN domain-containing protein n=1 Tax=Polyangium aurulentum TaxID=2567896 RepID=UPI0010AE1AF9|nr:RICIN domain-containing protein [Polyangium aurulentum]UQA62213.1 RICIN domain-containing protein [Polyangium aurulentum]
MRASRIPGLFALTSALVVGCAEDGAEDLALGTTQHALVARGVQLCRGRDGRERCMSLNLNNFSITLRKRKQHHSLQAFDVIKVYDDLHMISYGGEAYNCLDVPLFRQGWLVGLAPCIAGVLDPRAAAQLWTLEAIPENSALQIRNGASRDFCLASMRHPAREKETVVGIAHCEQNPGPAQRWTMRGGTSAEDEEESASHETAALDDSREDEEETEAGSDW